MADRVAILDRPSPTALSKASFCMRTLLLHIDGDEGFESRLALATDVARAHGAKLFCVFVPLPAPYFYGEYIPVDLIQRHNEAERARAEQLRAGLASRLSREGIVWEWRELNGPLEPALAAAGAIADLILMSQDRLDAESPAIAAVALSAGRPVLCVPHSGTFRTCGRRILVAWNGSRESARAAHDALPFLVRADRVVLFAAEEKSPAGSSVMDAAAHLSAHGATIEVTRTTLNDIDIGTAILNAASDTSADLIVMGAYGHTRLREWAFGGATRTILESMTAPVLLSH
jgi:nucleotide-binding universal stress UspA family protein